MKRWMKLVLGLAVLLMIASFPACLWGSHIVEGELSKLSPTEVELHQFDANYVMWILPSIWMFSIGFILAVIPVAIWVAERRDARALRNR